MNTSIFKRQLVSLLFILIFFISPLFSPFINNINAVTGDTWWNNAYEYRKTLTFNNSTQAENLTNFPVLVKLTSLNFDFSKTQSAGQDIRFLDSDNFTVLSYEIEKWDNSTQEAIIWVKVPQIDATSNTDFIYIYYGNANATDNQSSENVWNSNYKSVWHLQESPSGTAPQMQDSTSQNNHGTAYSPVSQISGKIGSALNVSGTNGSVNNGMVTTSNNSILKFSSTQDFSISAWIKTTQNSDYGFIAGNQPSATRLGYHLLLTGSTGKVLFAVGNSCCPAAESSMAVNDGQWHFVEGMRRGNNMHIYVDGVLAGTKLNGAQVGQSVSAFRIGKEPNNFFQFTGQVDEVRVSDVAHSASWINAVHKSETDTFITFSSESNTSVSKDFSLNNSVTTGNDGKLRLSGKMSTKDPSFTIRNIEYSVNGGGWNNATALDGTFNSITEDFYLEFLATDNNYQEDGYTVKVRAISSGGTIADNLFYFSPFTSNAPSNNSYTTNELPTFEFTVNKGRFQDLRDNLSKFQVLINKDNQGWQTYIDNIPVSYEGIKNSGDNKLPAESNTQGNGTFESNKLWAQYSNDNSSIKVYSKPVDDGGNITDAYFNQGGKKLSGSYQWKVVAVDKAGHSQETETRFLRIKTNQVISSQNFFPLAVLNITGLGNPDISTTNLLGVKSTYSLSSSTPTFYGIANVNSKVTLELTDKACVESGQTECVKTFETTTNAESRYGINVPSQSLISGKTYSTRMFVSQDNDYNELPQFELKLK